MQKERFDHKGWVDAQPFFACLKKRKKVLSFERRSFVPGALTKPQNGSQTKLNAVDDITKGLGSQPATMENIEETKEPIPHTPQRFSRPSFLPRPNRR